MDLGTWSFVLSIVALLLIYPVGLLVNMTTPTVVRGLFNMSRRKLEKRVKFLESKLAEDNAWIMTSAELAQYKFVGRLFKYLFVGLHSVLSVIIIFAVEYQNSTHGFSSESYGVVITVLIVFLIGNTIEFFANRKRWVEPYWYHSAECRNLIQKQIDNIRARLDLTTS